MNMRELFLKYYEKSKEIIKYLIFGVLTTVVNYISYVMCAKLFKIDVVISTGVAWLLSVLFAYVTNKIYVFESKINRKSEILREILSFFGLRALSGVWDVAIMYVSVNLMGLNDLIMKLVSNVIIIVLNYVFSKIFIFKKNK